MGSEMCIRDRDKSATFTGILQVVDGEFVLKAQNVQMGCPSKYEPAEE